MRGKCDLVDILNVIMAEISFYLSSSQVHWSDVHWVMFIKLQTDLRNLKNVVLT